MRRSAAIALAACLAVGSCVRVRPPSVVRSGATAPQLSRSAFLAAAAAGSAALLGKPDAANAAFGSARAAVTSAPDVNLEKLSEATQVDELLKLSPKKLRQVQSALGPNEIDNILKEIDQRREVLTAQIEKDVLSEVKFSGKKRFILDSISAERDRLRRLRKARKTDADNKDFATNRAAQGRRREVITVLNEISKLEKEIIVAENAERASGKLRDEELPRLRADLARLDVIESGLSKRDAILRKLGEQPEWFNYFAALVASLVSTSIMHPIDTIKTRQASAAARLPPAARPPAAREPAGPRVIPPAHPPFRLRPAQVAQLSEDIEPCILSQECELPPSPFDELAPPPPDADDPPAAGSSAHAPSTAPVYAAAAPAHAAAEPAAAVATAAPAAVGGAFSLLEERASRLGAAAADADASAAAAATASVL